MTVKIKILALLCIIVFVFVHNRSKAQGNNIEFNFKKLNADHGLSNGIVYGILQDKKGYMWFSTQDGGLNRYDGYSFKVFKYDPRDQRSIPSNNTNFILEDKIGNIWVSTWGNGAAKYDPTKDEFKTYRYEEKCKNCISSNKVQSIMLDNNDIFIGTADGGLNILDTRNDKIRVFKHDSKNKKSLSNNRIWGVVKDKKGTYWIATTYGLNSFDGKTDKFGVLLNDPNNTNSLCDNQIRAIAIDGKGIVWIGTKAGLDRFDPTTKTFHHYDLYEKGKTNSLKNKINSVFADKNGIIWIGTEQGGLNRFDPQTGNLAHFTNHPNDLNSISYDDVRFITQDRTGLIWIGTRGGGVNYFDPVVNSFKSFTSNSDNELFLTAKRVTSLTADSSGGVWIGTDTGGLNFFDPVHRKMEHFNTSSKFGRLTGNLIKSLAMDSLGRVWIGSFDAGINILDSKTGKVIVFDKDNGSKYGLDYNEVNVLYRDYKNNMWVGTNQGLYKFESQLNKFKKYKADANDPNSLTDSRILSISGDNTHVWIGTDDGLNLYDYKNNNFKRFTHNRNKKTSISSNRIYSIFYDSHHNLWVGTEFGLNLFDPIKETFKNFDERDGFAGAAMLCINEDNGGRLWVGTSSGLSRFSYPKVNVKNYDYVDGLLCNEFLIGSTAKNKFGYLFYGTSEGVAYFNPESLKPYTAIPEVALTDFFLYDKVQRPGESRVLNKTISYADTIVLTHKDFVFSIEYTAFDFLSPTRNKYAYKMEGFDKEWTITNRRYATYTSLPDGKYFFRVKAANSKGVWNNKGLTLMIIIQPPFWKTWWFDTLSILFVIATVFFFIKLRTRILEQEKLNLEKIVTERTDEIVKQKDEIEAQRDWANKQRSEITSSIQYARRIQGAILPPVEYLNVLVKEFFIFYKPKDIVSGDFYYAEEVEGKIIIAVADCTGHGVPGAFMSLLGISFLTEILSKLHHEIERHIIDEIKAGYLLDCLKAKLVTSLHQTGKLGNSKDGMDISLIVIDKDKREMEFSGANNPIYVYSDSQLTMFHADRMPIGYRPNSNQLFSNQKISLKEDDIVYLFTDGYLDQFGGPKGRKFLSKNFSSLLEEISPLPFEEQRERIQNNFFEWKGSNMQVDDILVMGIKII